MILSATHIYQNISVKQKNTIIFKSFNFKFTDIEYWLWILTDSEKMIFKIAWILSILSSALSKSRIKVACGSSNQIDSLSTLFMEMPQKNMSNRHTLKSMKKRPTLHKLILRLLAQWFKQSLTAMHVHCTGPFCNTCVGS